MPTRLYLTNAAAGYTPTTKQGAWDLSTASLARALSTNPSGAAATAAITKSSATNNYDVLWGRWISDPIAKTGTLSGTLAWIAGVVETSNLALNAFFHVHAFVTVGDSDTVRGTLLTDNIGATEFTGTVTGRGEGAKTVTSVACTAGDRIVVELGFQAQTTGTGNSATLNYGNAGPTDLAQNGTGGTNGPTVRPGYVEFSDPANIIDRKIETTVDDFSSGSIDDAVRWPGAYGTYSVVSGRARVAIGQTGGVPDYSGLMTDPVFGMSGSAQFIEVTTVPTGASDVISLFTVELPTTPGTYVGFTVIGGTTLQFTNAVEYDDSDSTTVTYNATTHRWWRLRHDGATLYWDTSTDGGTWTNRRSITAPNWTRRGGLATGIYGERSVGTASYYEFDNVNTVPPAVPIVAAGADATITVGDTFTRTATNSGGTAASWAWTIEDGPDDDGVTIGTAAALSWTPDVTGTYTLRATATNTGGSAYDEVVVTVAAVVLAETLTEDFDDNSINAVKWPNNYGTVAESGQTARVTHLTDGSGYGSQPIYTIKDSAVLAQVTPAAKASGATLWSTQISAYLDAPTYAKQLVALIDGVSGNLYFDYNDSATPANSWVTSTTYDPVAHAWLRIRESGGTVYCDTSPDGRTWTATLSHATPADVLTAHAVELDFEAFRTGGSNAVSVFDNINLPPAFTEVPGTAAAALGGLSASALGLPTVLGSAAATLGALVATAAGQPDAVGAAAAALGSLTGTAAGLRGAVGVASGELGALTATASATTSSSVVSLGANTGFEWDANSDGLADGWSVYGSPTTTLDAGIKRSGAHSQKVVVAGGNNEDIRFTPITVTAGLPYSISVWAYVYATAGAFVAKVEWLDAGGSVVNYDYTVVNTPDSDFTRRAFTSTPGVGVVSGRVIFAVEGGGTVYLDEWQLEQSATSHGYVEPDIDWMMRAAFTATDPSGTDGAIGWYIDRQAIRPYEASFTAIGLLAGARTFGVQTFADTAWAWLGWYRDHMESDGTTYDYDIVGGTLTKLSTRDSTDSYAGLYLLALRAAMIVDPRSLSAFADSIGLALDAVELTLQGDGLTWASPEFHAKYLMDQVETASGVFAAAELAGALGDATLAARATDMGRAMVLGIEHVMWNPATPDTPAYDWALSDTDDHTVTDWADLLDALQQMWAAAFGAPDADRSSGLAEAFLDAHPEWSDPATSGRYDAFVAIALQRVGLDDEAAAGVREIQRQSQAADREWDWNPLKASWVVLAEQHAADLLYDLPGPTVVAEAASATLGQLTATAGGVRGTAGAANASLGALTATASAVVASPATAIAGLGPLAAEAAAVAAVPAASAALLGALDATAVGGRSATSSGTAALGPLTATASGGRATEAAAAADLGTLSGTVSATVQVPGTAAAVLGGLTGSASATITVIATGAAPLGPLVASAAGDSYRPGTGIADLGALAATATGGVGHDATAVAALGGLTADAVVTPTGVADAPLGELTGLAAGARHAAGTASAVLGPLTAAVAGVATVVASAAADLGALTATATGLAAVPATGVATLGELTATATGVRATTGMAAADLGPLEGLGTATGAKPGAATASLGQLTAAAAAYVTVTGTASAAFEFTAHVAGVRAATGQAVALLGGLQAQAEATGGGTGTAAAPLGELTAAGGGTPTVQAAASAELGQLTAHADGLNTATAHAAAQLGALTGLASSVRDVQAQAVAALGALAAAASGTPTSVGAAAAFLGGLTAVAAGAGTTPEPNHGLAQLGGLTAAAFGARLVAAVAHAQLGGLDANATSSTATINYPLHAGDPVCQPGHLHAGEPVVASPW